MGADNMVVSYGALEEHHDWDYEAVEDGQNPFMTSWFVAKSSGFPSFLFSGTFLWLT